MVQEPSRRTHVQIRRETMVEQGANVGDVLRRVPGVQVQRIPAAPVAVISLNVGVPGGVAPVTPRSTISDRRRTGGVRSPATALDGADLCINRDATLSVARVRCVMA